MGKMGNKDALSSHAKAVETACAVECTPYSARFDASAFVNVIGIYAETRVCLDKATDTPSPNSTVNQ